MLDRSKLIQQFEQHNDQLFQTDADQFAAARQLWLALMHDRTLSSKLHAAFSALPIPTWQEPLGACYPAQNLPSAYRIISVDGSQIYPDRHQGVPCALINIGLVDIAYDANSRVFLQSTPSLLTYAQESGFELSIDLVNCKRDERELQTGVEHAKQLQQVGEQLLILFDGSLIFWHLEEKEQVIKDYFFKSYTSSLQQLYEQRILHAHYISMPRNNDITNVLRLAARDFALDVYQQNPPFAQLRDGTIASWYLDPYCYTTLFEYRGAYAAYYPPMLKPYFIYLHNGNEIARVELPAWIALDDTYRAMVMHIIVDQCIKGQGYPVVLAEAHEQAVIKGADRDFFYHLLAQQTIARNQVMRMSQKSMKKRRLGI